MSQSLVPLPFVLRTAVAEVMTVEAVTARKLGSPTSLPYFIPMPFGLGTLGAVINMVAPPRNRRHPLAIAVAGPLAGLVVALPLLFIGLKLSHIQPLPVGPLPNGGGYVVEGNSVLYAALKYAVFGRLLPSNGQDVFAGQIAFAGWVVLIFFLGRLRAEPLDDLTQLTSRQRILAAAMIVIFFLVFAPIPMREITG